jgi:CRP-like cAMP-binding protein
VEWEPAASPDARRAYLLTMYAFVLDRPVSVQADAPPVPIATPGRSASLPAPAAAALRRLLSANVRSVRPRTVFVEAGSPMTEINVMIEGWAIRVATLADGTRQIVAFHLPGDICEFNALLAGVADTSVEAVGPARVAAISRRAMAGLTEDFPRASQAMWRESWVAAATQRAWLVNACRRSAIERAAHLLCELHARAELAELVDGDSFECPLTQGHLASAANLTTEHMNRCLRQLREERLVEIGEGQLAVRDRNALAARASFDGAYLTQV